MKARGKKLVHVFMPVLLACLLLLTCTAYAAPAAAQKSTPQVQPAPSAASSLLNPNAPPQGSITITSPQSGATWYTGMYYPVQWTCNGTRSNLVDVTLWRNNRQAATIWTAADTGRTAYIVPLGTAEGSYEVRVTSAGDTRVEARLPVTIATTAVWLTSPPANIVTGSSYTITWSYTGNLSSINLSTLDSSGAVVQSVPNIPIGSNGTGSLSWNAPALPAGKTSAQYCFQFSALLPTSVTSSTKVDTVLAKAELFTISRGSITITAPKQNEVLNMNSKYTITWTYKGNLVPIYVWYKDVYGNKNLIQQSDYPWDSQPKIVMANGQGSVVWTVQPIEVSSSSPMPQTSQYSIIVSTGDKPPIEASSGPFSMICKTNLCGYTCTDVQTDVLNCGWCGHKCDWYGGFTICNKGVCQCGIAQQTSCPDGPDFYRCTWLISDSSNCGACGRKCLPGQTCLNASCICAPPRVMCGSSCSDLSDTSNCGKCGNICPYNQPYCVNGKCQANDPNMPPDLNTVLPSPLSQ